MTLIKKWSVNKFTNPKQGSLAKWKQIQTVGTQMGVEAKVSEIWRSDMINNTMNDMPWYTTYIYKS